MFLMRVTMTTTSHRSPNTAKADYDRRKDDLQHLKADELIEDATEICGEPQPEPK